MQLTGAPRFPVESHVWKAELPAHCVVPGAHVPWHDAVPLVTTHAELPHATAVPQLPLLSQVCTPWPEHWVEPGTHCPTQAPPTHAEFAQGAGAPNVPVLSQVSMPLFEQVVAVGVHEPVHAPFTHAWFEHETALLHWPFVSQVWTPFPEQLVVPGAHTPLQAPFTHANGHALVGVHVPVAEQVCTVLVEPPSASVAQLVAFGAHTPWHDAPAPVPTQA